jgi:hypothetical protein
MNMFWPVLAAGLVIVGPAPAAAAETRSLPSFASEGYRARVVGFYPDVERALLFRRLSRNAANGPRWLIERRERGYQIAGGPQGAYAWIDSRDCDAVASAMAGLGALPPVAITAPRSFAEPLTLPLFHHPETTLEAWPVNMAGSAVSVTIRGQTGPVAQWLKATEEALEACWRQGAPTIDGRSIPPALPAFQPRGD